MSFTRKKIVTYTLIFCLFLLVSALIVLFLHVSGNSELRELSEEKARIDDDITLLRTNGTSRAWTGDAVLIYDFERDDAKEANDEL